MADKNNSGNEKGMTEARVLSPLAVLGPVILALFLLGGSVVLWRHETQLEAQAAQSHFKRGTERINAAILARVSDYEKLLRAANGMFSHAHHVGIEEWTAFLRSIDFNTNYPGISGLGYVANVSQDGLSRFLQEREKDWPGYTISPSGERDAYYPITHIEPLDQLSPLMGFDPGTQPRRWDAMAQAMDTGEAVITKKIAHIIPDRSESGLALFFPVYRQDVPLDTVEQRRAQNLGWVIAHFSAKFMFAGILRPADDIDVALFDGPRVNANKLIFDTASEDQGRPLESRRTYHKNMKIRVAGRDWLARYSSTEGFVTAGSGEAAWVILVIGLLLSGALPAALYMALTGHVRADHLAASMTWALRRSEQRFRAIADYTYDWEFWLGPKGTLRWVNPAVERLAGYSVEDCMAMAEYPLPMIHEADQQKMKALLDAAIGGGLDDDVEVRIHCKDGEIKWAGVSYQPIFDEKDHFIGSRLSIRETSQRKKMEQALIESNKELENFAYVASHDLQEPLRMVIGYNQLLAKKYKGKLDSDADEFIEYAVEGAFRMQQLIKDLLSYSRVGTTGKPLEPTDMEEALDTALANLSLVIEETGVMIYPGPLPRVLGDRGQLVSLMQNLIGNAIKYRNEGQVPRIDISAKRVENMWQVSVADSGIGIDPNQFERVFLIFQRLHGHGQYEGTGIGLAVCKKIVERHGGHIWLDSEPGKGTVFHFTLQPVPDTDPQPEEHA